MALSTDHGDLARQFFRSNRQMFDLIAEPKPAIAFEVALRKLFIESDDGTRTAWFRKEECCLAGTSKDLVAFLPTAWRVKLDRVSDVWPGCEKWWAGYPVIALIDARAHDDGKGCLTLHFEVGPLADNGLRNLIIATIAELSCEFGVHRIQFPSERVNKRSLYSRFLRRNSRQVNAFNDASEIEEKIRELVLDFSIETACVASSLSRIAIQ